MISEAKIFWAAMQWLNINRLNIIEKDFGNLESAYEKIDEKYLKRIGEGDYPIKLFLEKRSKLNIKNQKFMLTKHDAKILFIRDKNYPENLKKISDPPIFLYYQGNIISKDNTSLGVVGSRKISNYGKQVSKKIIEGLTDYFTIVSGFAYGIDTCAHEISLENKGRTIGVFGNGLDITYPSSNLCLKKKILDTGSGALITEFNFGQSPDKYNFPKRNRIIAAMTLGTLVIEAREKSGSLITANFALEYNREVFGVPGNIFESGSYWINKLIQSGEAKLVQSAEDILEEFQFKIIKNTNNSLKLENLDESELTIISVLGYDGKDFSYISNITGFSLQEVSSKMLLLEIKGYVSNIGMNMWVKNL